MGNSIQYSFLDSNNQTFDNFVNGTDKEAMPPLVLLISGIVLLVIGMILQLLLVSYEFSMDPMKRSVINQVSTTMF